ncbi:unnamed protein product, partial [Prorocentrum cordatum]
KVKLHYRDGEWHARLLIRETTEDMMLQQTGELPTEPGLPVWWVATRDGDVYPEQVGEGASLDTRSYHANGALVPRAARPGFRAGDPFFDFEPGTSLAELYVATLAAAEAVEGVAPAGALALPGAAPPGPPGGGAPAAEPPAPEAAAAPVAVDDEGDLRVLPVKWRGDKRYRPFSEAVDSMEHVEFNDCELEGDPSAEWYLHKMVQTGLAPVARSRAWASESGIPAGDRSVHEHHVIMKVVQTAAERDQLNLMCLESDRESAHANSPANADYTHADDMMGWGVTKGGALVVPALTRHVASRAAERSSILKGQRKHAEEMRLSRGRKPPKGAGKGGEGTPGADGAGAAK